MEGGGEVCSSCYEAELVIKKKDRRENIQDPGSEEILANRISSKGKLKIS